MKPLGPIAYIIKARTTLLRDLGSAMSPFNAFLTLQGIETLPLRMERHCAMRWRSRNFWQAAGARSRRSSIRRSRAAQAPSARRKYLKGGQGGLVGFEIKGGREAGRRFIDALELFYHVANIGDARSLAIHPATTTHSQLSPEEQLATGVTEGYVRLSIGLEHIDDILADLDRRAEGVALSSRSRREPGGELHSAASSSPPRDARRFPGLAGRRDALNSSEDCAGHLLPPALHRRGDSEVVAILGDRAPRDDDVGGAQPIDDVVVGENLARILGVDHLLDA